MSIERARASESSGTKDGGSGRVGAASSGGASVQLKQSLRGLDFGAQEARLSPVQMKGVGGDNSHVHEAAQRGVAGGGGALPHRDAIQKSFGTHDVSGVKAHVGGEAAGAAKAMGADAYATGSDIAFKESPDLHTTAHEAAHVVQQRAGVSLSGGVGKAGDSYEQQADAVADAVVAGRSAEGLLGPGGIGGGTGVQRREVQRKVTFKNDADVDVTIEDYAGSGEEKEKVEECKTNIASGKAPADFDWVKERVANNGGKVPGKISQFIAKWGSPHGNHDGLLPGIKGAGGYNEYYVREQDGISPNRRIVKRASTGDLFFSNTHYGNKGNPAFYHLT